MQESKFKTKAVGDGLNNYSVEQIAMGSRSANSVVGQVESTSNVGARSRSITTRAVGLGTSEDVRVRPSISLISSSIVRSLSQILEIEINH